MITREKRRRVRRKFCPSATCPPQISQGPAGIEIAALLSGVGNEPPEPSHGIDAEIQLRSTYIFRSYFTVNILLLYYKYQSVNAMWRKDCCLCEKDVVFSCNIGWIMQ